jgi:phage terminase large subunit GpA-like protein
MLFNSNALKDAMFGRLENNNLGKGMFRYPDWLCDWFYSEMCSEIRTDKGWIRTNQKRNEAIDLSYYALGACVSPLIRAEGINWRTRQGGRSRGTKEMIWSTRQRSWKSRLTNRIIPGIKVWTLRH